MLGFVAFPVFVAGAFVQLTLNAISKKNNTQGLNENFDVSIG